MKHELPPFHMTVGTGKLTPADPYTAERLDSYRNGTVMLFQPVVDSQSWKRKKYWAILNRVVADCRTPWKNSAEASQALKLALGIVDQGLTISGAVVRYPKSLNDLQEPDFETFFEGAMLLLYRVTGVDPETLWKESAGSGKDQKSSTSSPRSEVDEGSGDELPRTVAAAAPNETVPVASAAQQIADRPGGSNPPPGHLNDLKAEAITKILQYATDPNVSAEALLDNLLGVQTGWLVHMPNNSAFIKTCCETAAKVIRGEITPDAARKYLLSLS